jgi:hypothetical protein
VDSQATCKAIPPSYGKTETTSAETLAELRIL